MPDTVGGFNDLVQLSGDTLYHLGEEFLVGNSAASTVTIGFSNSAGILALAAAQTGNETVNLPSGGTLLSNINISAGTFSANLSAVTFSNSNNVSFGLAGSTVTASVTVASSQGSINVSAQGYQGGGANSYNLTQLIFSNSSNVSFGIVGESLTGVAYIVISAGGTNTAYSAFSFSNLNNVSFGLNGNAISASYALNVTVPGSSVNANQILFSNSNGVSFGLNGNEITASIAQYLSNINVSAGTTSNNLSNIVFSNSVGNGVSFGLNGATITASVNTAWSIVLSAGTQAQYGSEFTFANSNNVSFGMNNSVITASVNSIGIAAGAFTGSTGNIFFENSNNIIFGMSNNSLAVTASYNFNVSAGTTSNNLNAVTFSNSNGISFGLNGSVITASNNSVAIAAGTQTAGSGGTVVLSNSNGFSFGMSNSSVVTAAYGGFSSWSAGPVHTTYSSSSAFLSLQPIVVPYEITVRNLVWIANASAATNSSGGINVSAGLYTINAGTTGSLSIASSSSTALTFTSGAALSSYTGVAYRQMAVSWALTPGPYVFAFAAAPINAASFTFNGIHDPSAINFASGLGAAMSNMILPGISVSSVGSIPSSIGITNTSGYLRTGSQVLNQPWFLFQGT
jgi:hypothetical protein